MEILAGSVPAMGIRAMVVGSGERLPAAGLDGGGSELGGDGGK